jgi:hypothetical protein
VNRYEKHGRNPSWIVKRFGKYRRKLCIFQIFSLFTSIFSISFHNFLPYCPYLFTIQLAFLRYFPYHFTIFFRKKPKLNSEKIWKIQKKIVKRYEKYGRKVGWIVNKGKNKITELRTILQRKSQNFSQFSGCWLILSVYILMSFDFSFVRLFGVQ